MAPQRTLIRRTAGFTLIDLLIALGILSVVLTTAGFVQTRANEASVTMLAQDSAEARARHALDRVAQELTGVGKTLIFPDPNTNFGASAMTFQRAAGVSNLGVVQWSTPSRLELVIDPRELDNGVDDDSDGLVDEHQLAFTSDIGTASARTVVLCTGIPELVDGETVNTIDDNGNGVADEAGFNIRRLGDLLTVRICVTSPFSGNQIATTTLETSIVLHN